jgi:hypothetical protein
MASGGLTAAVGTAAAARVIAAAAAGDTAVATIAVAWRLDLGLGDQLGRVAAIDAVDFLVARGGAAVLARAVGNVRVAVGVCARGRGERTRRAVVLRVRSAQGQRGQRGYVRPVHAVFGVAPRACLLAVGRVIFEGVGAGAGGAAGRVAGVRRAGVVLRGAREAVGARAGRAGAVARVVVGRISEGACRRAGGVVCAPRRRRAVVA